MIRAVVFDFEQTLAAFPRFRGGTRRGLFDTGAARVYAFLHARNCRLPRFDRFLRHQRWMARCVAWRQRFSLEEPDPRRFLRRVCIDYGLQRDDTALGTLGWLWYGPRAETAVVDDDVLPTLKKLRDSGIKLGVILNTPLLGRVVDQHLAAMRLLELFDVRIYSSEIGARMPNPRFFQTVLSELGIGASEAAIVSAQQKKVLIPAAQVGITGILKSSGATGARCIASLAQLPALLDVLTAEPGPEAPQSMPQIN